MLKRIKNYIKKKWFEKRFADGHMLKAKFRQSIRRESLLRLGLQTARAEPQ